MDSFPVENLSLRIGIISKTFDIDVDRPLNTNHPAANQIKETISKLIHQPKASFNPVRGQWNYVGPCQLLPNCLKAARNGKGWVLPTKDGSKMGYTVTPTDVHGHIQLLRPTLTQVRTQAFVYLSEEGRQAMARVLQRTFERTYGANVVKVENHPRFGTPDEKSLFPLAEFCWAYVVTSAPLKYRPAFITRDDIGDESVVMSLLGTTLWQEPMLDFDLVAPHRGCPYCHSLGHGNKACDALYLHRRWLKHQSGNHPLEEAVQKAVRHQDQPQAQEDEEPATQGSDHVPKVRFVRIERTMAPLAASASDGQERDHNPSSKRSRTDDPIYSAQSFTVPDGVPAEVYNALQRAYSVVHDDQALPNAAKEVIASLKRNSIFPPEGDSRGAGFQRQVDAMCMTLKAYRIPGFKRPEGKPTNMESYFMTLFNKNPFKPDVTGAAARPAAANQSTMTQFLQGTNGGKPPSNSKTPSELASSKKKKTDRPSAAAAPAQESLPDSAQHHMELQVASVTPAPGANDMELGDPSSDPLGPPPTTPSQQERTSS